MVSLVIYVMMYESSSACWGRLITWDMVQDSVSSRDNFLCFSVISEPILAFALSISPASSFKRVVSALTTRNVKKQVQEVVKIPQWARSDTHQLKEEKPFFHAPTRANPRPPSLSLKNKSKEKKKEEKRELIKTEEEKADRNWYRFLRPRWWSSVSALPPIFWLPPPRYLGYQRRLVRAMTTMISIWIDKNAEGNSGWKIKKLTIHLRSQPFNVLQVFLHLSVFCCSVLDHQCLTWNYPRNY